MIKFAFIFIVACFGLAPMWTAHGNPSDAMGACECGAFATYASTDPDLIVSRKTINTTCSDEGRETCIIFCRSLAALATEKGIHAICQFMGHSDLLEVLVQARVCDNMWHSTGWKSENPICCHKGKPRKCEKDV